MVDLFRYRKWDLVSHRRIYYIISGLMLLAGIVAFIMNVQKSGFGLNEGIDFRGGGLVTYGMQGKLPADKHAVIVKDIRDELASKGIESDVMVSPGGLGNAGDQILIRVLLAKGSQETAETQDALLTQRIGETITPTVTTAVAPYPAAGSPELLSKDAVDPSISANLKRDGVLAMLIGSTLILFWIWMRYNVGGFGWKYGVTGIIALVHDLGTLVGMFAIFHNVLQVNSPFIAALLTVLGYSIHDTIVIFDRIRENLRLRKGRTFAETVNISLLETMARSVNTVLTVLFTLLALFFFGGPTLRDFVSAMLIGVAVGAYSSIFVASQLLVSWSTPDQKIIPSIDVPVPAMAGIAPKPATDAGIVMDAAPTAASTPKPADAIQRARQAGKTARRRR